MPDASRRICLAVALLLAAGCQNKPAPKPGSLVNVGGTALNRDGEPLVGYGLRFKPDPPGAMDTTTIFSVKKDGTFGGNCKPGKYRVTLLRPHKLADEANAPEPQYWDVTVPASGRKRLVLQAE